jgi:multidrug efflux pump
MGIAVFTGMVGVTLFGIFLTPVFYMLLRRGGARRADPAHPTASASHPVAAIPQLPVRGDANA